MNEAFRKFCWAWALACGLIGCQATEPHRRLAEEARPTWPDRLAGRTLRATTDDYVLYAPNGVEAGQLQAWLDQEIAEYRSRYGPFAGGPGMVFAIGAGEEPVTAIEEWRRKNVHRSRLLVWKYHARDLGPPWPFRGRPYCLDREPYYTESFSMPYEQGVHAGLLDPALKPAWICFLATDQHMVEEFDELILRRREQSLEKLVELFKDPRFPAAFVLSFPAMPIFLIGHVYISQRYRSIDIDLMQLQRRETLWGALIDWSVPDDSERERKLKALCEEIDEAWKRLFLHRPID